MLLFRQRLFRRFASAPLISSALRRPFYFTYLSPMHTYTPWPVRSKFPSRLVYLQAVAVKLIRITQKTLPPVGGKVDSNRGLDTRSRSFPFESRWEIRWIPVCTCVSLEYPLENVSIVPHPGDREECGRSKSRREWREGDLSGTGRVLAAGSIGREEAGESVPTCSFPNDRSPTKLSRASPLPPSPQRGFLAALSPPFYSWRA